MKPLCAICSALIVLLCATTVTSAQLKLLTPNGGEILIEGTQFYITWTGVSQFEIVSIDFQRDSGSQWELITSSASGLEYLWDVPIGILSNSCRIRIRTKQNVRSDGTTVRIMAGGHGVSSNAAAFSHDGSHLYTVGEAPIVKEWNAWTGELLREFSGTYADPVLAISPNDRTLVFSGDSAIQIVDLITGVTTTVDVDAPVKSLQFNRASTHVVAALRSLHAVVINISQRRIEQDFTHPNMVNGAEFSQDGNLIVTACTDKSARIWNVEGDSVLHRLKNHTINNFTAKFSPNGQRVVTTGFENVVRIWDVVSGQIIDSLVHDDYVLYAEFSPDGRQIVTACRDNKGHVWSASAFEHLFELQPHSYDVSSARYSPDGDYIYTHNTYRQVFVWNAITGARVFEPAGHTSDITSATFSADNRIAITSLDAGVRVYDISAQQLIYTVLGHSQVGGGYQGRVKRASFDAPESNVLSASEDGTVRSWNAITGTYKFGSQTQPYTYDYVHVHKPSGRYVGTYTYGAVLFSANGKQLGEFSTGADQRTLRKSVFSPNGEYIAVVPDRAYQDTTMNIISGVDGRLLHTLSRYDEAFVDAVFSPNSRWMATITDQSQVRVYDAQTGDEAYHFTAGIHPLEQIEFSPNGKLLSFRGESEYIWLVDTDTWLMIDSLESTRYIKRMAWSPDSKLIATVALDIVDVLDVERRLPVAHFLIESHFSNESDVQFSPDGKRLATMNSNVDVYETSGWTPTHHLDGRNLMRHIQWASDNNRMLVVSLHHQPWVWDLTPAIEFTDESDEGFYIIDDQVSVHEDALHSLHIYPNPASDVLYIDITSGLVQTSFEIVDALGIAVMRGPIRTARNAVSVSMLPSGIYFIRMDDASALFVKN